MKWLLPLVLLASAPSFAQEEPGLRDVQHARTMAMGGAFRALGLGADASVGNPASMPLLKRYQMDLSGAYDVQTKFGYGAAAVLDSVTSQVAAGVHYAFVSLGREADHRFAHVTTLATGAALSEVVHIGLSGKHILENGSRTANAMTMDAGLLFRFGSLAVAVTGHNLIDIRNPDLPRHFAFSAGWMGGAFNVAADVKADFNGPTSTPRMAYALGAEYIAGQTFPLRVGYSIDTLHQNQYLAFGVGYLENGSGVDFAYRHELGGKEGHALVLTLSMQL